jgi:Mu-like prophage FluMu N-terminal domain
MASRLSKTKSSSPSAAAPPPAAAASEPAADPAVKAGTANPSGSGGPGGLPSSEVSSPAADATAGPGLEAGAAQGADMPAAPETAAGADRQTMPELVCFDLTRTPTEDEISAAALLAAHLRRHAVVVDGLAAPAETVAPETAPGFAADIGSAFPRLLALLVSFTEERSADHPPKLRIKAAHDGFRRAGVAHDRQGRDYDLDAFTGTEIEAMLGDGKLTVELV